MVPAQPTGGEAERLKALRDYAVLDTLPDKALDDLTALAAQICGAPIAMVSLVDEKRQWFKSKVGIDTLETPRDISFCGHAVQQRELFIVPDAKLDERFSDNPLVTGEPHVRFYAGAPLVSPTGEAIGALCVIDHVPRQLTPEQEQTLRVLARQVMTDLELRKHMRALIESEQQLELVTENSHVGLAIVNRERCYAYANSAYAQIFCLPSADLVGKRMHDVFPGLYDKQIAHRLDRAFAGERATYEMHKSVEGEERHYTIRYEPSSGEGSVPFVVLVITDVTSRKQAEINSLRLASIVEFSDDAILSKNLNSIITTWNKGAEKTFGYTAEEIVGKSIMQLIPEDRRSEEEEILRRIGRGESTEHFETRRRTKDGRMIDVAVTASPIKDANGLPIGACTIARDITGRKQADEKLRLLSACVARLNDIVLITEADQIDEPGPKILFANEALERITGFTIAEVMGKSPRFLQGKNTDRAVLAEIREALTQKEPVRRQIVNYGKNGKAYWLDIDIVPIFNDAGKCTHFVAIQRDVTEAKRAAEQITEQAALLDKAQDAILVGDLDGTITFWNKGAENMYGWSQSEVLGQKVADKIYADPKQFQQIIAQIVEKGELSGEIEHITKSGRKLTVEARRTLIRDELGNPRSVLVIYTDITEKKKIEAQFMRAQRMESIGTLAGGVAHDLNNILAPILMSIDILKSTSDTPQTAQILKTIETSAKRGADIVRQVLSFARGLEGERIEVQPKHLLKDLESIIKDTFPKDIQLQFAIPKDIWTILGDPTQIHQILLNLCVNARDAMPVGGTLKVSVENCVLDEQYAAMNLQAKPGRYVKIMVTDSGIGMPSEIIDKIFEPFFTTKEHNKGTGLGLSTVMAIVKSHDGIINVYSEVGKGTTFKVCLPALVDASGESMGQAIESSLPRGNGETVLVVDDEASILTITGQTLQAFGYKVLTASDGADAVVVYAQHLNEIAVVLTDMMMPIMDGPALIHALMRINPQVKIVAASGLNLTGGTTQIPGLSVKHFLTKPYTAGTLLKTMRTILNEKP